jgi:hypothetical protein
MDCLKKALISLYNICNVDVLFVMYEVNFETSKACFRSVGLCIIVSLTYIHVIPNTLCLQRTLVCWDLWHGEKTFKNISLLCKVWRHDVAKLWMGSQQQEIVSSYSPALLLLAYVRILSDNEQANWYGRGRSVCDLLVNCVRRCVCGKWRK